jgi:ABC-2 type transport system ATP-binding protein
VVSTHQVEEIQHILTDVVFIDRGKIVLDASMEDLEVRFVELVAGPEQAATARTYRPIHERQVFGRTHLLFDGMAREPLASLGELRTPSLADIFVAVLGGRSRERAA